MSLGAALPAARPRLGTLSLIAAASGFLIVLAAAAAAALADTEAALAAAVQGRATVEVIDADPARQARAAAAARARLATVAGVGAVRPVPAAELARLLAGAVPDAAGLPLPALIDVDLARASANDLRRALAPLRQARVTRADGALAPLDGVLASLRRLALAILALAAGGTFAVVLLVARSTLATHAEVVGTLQALGATDRALATLVERRIARDALVGGTIGLVAALAVLRLLGAQAAALADGLAGAGGAGWRELPVLALIPPALALAAAAAGRATVLAALRRAP